MSVEGPTPGGPSLDAPRVGGLSVRLESPLPVSVPSGRASTVLCVGSCFHSEGAIRRLDVVVGGRRHPVSAHGMPRPDVFAMEHPEAGRIDRRRRLDPGSKRDPHLRALRSGFWAVVPVVARKPGHLDIDVLARLVDGTRATARLGTLRVAADPPAHASPPPSPVGSDVIAVCMATFEPDIALFRAQVESLRAQSDARWVCVISDDCSSEATYAEMRAVLGADPRFFVSRSDRRRNFYRNFERALKLAPAECELLALCDQDDRWYPDKLRALRAGLGTGQLVYSDQRLVDVDGRCLSETMWADRHNNVDSLASLLVANTVTGSAALFRREVAERAIPFPQTPDLQFHDHWLALVALATGELRYVDRPLYDYVQHGEAVLGGRTEADASPGRRRIAHLTRGGRSAYFHGFLSLEMLARELLLRCSSDLGRHKRREIRAFLASARSPAGVLWLLVRPLRALTGRTETLGSELELARGTAWRWVVDYASRTSRFPRLSFCDASWPAEPSFEQRRLRRWRARTGSRLAPAARARW